MLFHSLIEELEVFSTEEGRQLARDLIEMMHPESDGDDGIDEKVRPGRIARLYERVTARGGRIDGVKKLTEMLEKLVCLEREAYDLDDEKTGKGGIEDLLRQLGRAPVLSDSLSTH